MDKQEPIDARSWDAGWEGHRRAQLLRWARLSFQAKLQWLDDAQELMTAFKNKASPPSSVTHKPDRSR